MKQGLYTAAGIVVVWLVLATALLARGMVYSHTHVMGAGAEPMSAVWRVGQCM